MSCCPCLPTKGTKLRGIDDEIRVQELGGGNMSKPKVYIVFYSMYGHVRALAQEMKKGVEEAGGECLLYQVAETLSDEVLKKMSAPPKDTDIPVVDVHTLPDADGILFGTPTRFGAMCAQMKAMWDATGGLWQGGKLVGKPAGIFFSTATQAGGQETTALTALTQFTHHGMIFVPIGYTLGEVQFDMSEIHGGSAYGAGTFAGADGSRMPSEKELALAKHQGKYFTNVTKAIKAGRQST
ncbi:unnamed protein product [Vitrella brassicaformis CCMP3155]|uniref:Flavodoxin-like domain-containing protein n=1 Tax=Vitrella brassicaformis (strain CCMP3155) TaxID=1169540 RepID=A0A0G4F8J7_VITBC|nr:unnamed protein product [Vitrella brassicaformis CCMP3155]|eukprot:CEM08867.1 unnamed protein product [Vitrella brassicaformis CCMP3155]